MWMCVVWCIVSWSENQVLPWKTHITAQVHAQRQLGTKQLPAIRVPLPFPPPPPSPRPAVQDCLSQWGKGGEGGKM
jgi:hypothetical protein